MPRHNELVDILVHRLVRLITSSKDDSTPPQLAGDRVLQFMHV